MHKGIYFPEICLHTLKFDQFRSPFYLSVDKNIEMYQNGPKNFLWNIINTYIDGYFVKYKYLMATLALAASGQVYLLCRFPLDAFSSFGPEEKRVAVH